MGCLFSSRRRHTRCGRDWSSDVCSSDLIALAASDTGTTGSGQRGPSLSSDYSASSITHGVGANLVHNQCFLPLSSVCTRRSILGDRTWQCCCRRVSEDSRPQRHCLELLDGSVSAPWIGSCQSHPAGHCKGQDGLSGFPHTLERRRPRHSHPEASQGGIREAAITRSCREIPTVLRRLD